MCVSGCSYRFGGQEPCRNHLTCTHAGRQILNVKAGPRPQGQADVHICPGPQTIVTVEGSSETNEQSVPISPDGLDCYVAGLSVDFARARLAFHPPLHLIRLGQSLSGASDPA